MIIKFQEINKIKLEYNLYLFYGKNDGLKNEIINKIVKNRGELSTLTEKDVLDNFDIFFQNILSKSLFENEKIIVIKRATDKITKIIEEIDQRKDLLQDSIKILNDREKEILYSRRLKDDPVTLEDLSKRYKISRERIRQIENKAFEKIQKHMLNSAKSKNLLPAN